MASLALEACVLAVAERVLHAGDDAALDQCTDACHKELAGAEAVRS
jgi:hypothetical protein